MRKSSQVWFGAVVVCSLLLAACQVEQPATGPMQTTAVSIDKGNADHANVELNMSAGELNLRGGTEKLIDGSFEFNVPDWKPQVRSSLNGSHATVTIEEPHNVRSIGNVHYVYGTCNSTTRC